MGNLQEKFIRALSIVLNMISHRLLYFDKPNTLEVTVSKMSADASVNNAERLADYWIFGGIFRPVFLEATPKQYIDYVGIDAKA